jgi:hypothetical protein
MQATEIRAEVCKLLEDNHITVRIEPAGMGLMRDAWECDGWRVTLTRNGKACENFDYYTGIGHRVVSKMDTIRLKNWYGKAYKTTEEYKKYGKPVTPPIADVLYSLILDSEAKETNFHDWADTFGYDRDSIKANGIYKACLETSEKLTRVIPRDLLAQLADSVRDL